MKCPRCGFVSFDDLTHCKKCGTQLKETNEPVQEVKRSQAELSAVCTDSYDAALPPHWHNTIQTIKKELEAIEGGAVDKASSANRSPTLVAEKNSVTTAGYGENVLSPCSTAKKGGFYIRLLAYLIDCALLYSVTLTILLAGFFVLRSSAQNLAQTDTVTLLKLLITPYLIVSTVIEIFYFTYCYAVTGQTIGKWICGLKVVRADGTVLGFKRAFVRWLGYLVSRFFLYGGFIWIAFSREKQGWHDTMAGSYVIRV